MVRSCKAARIIALVLVTGAFACAANLTGQLELRGKVHYQAARYRILFISLFQVETPYTATTLTDPGGEFRFRDLRPGTYTVSVVRRGLGEVRRSVVVTPTLADKKGIVKVEIPFVPSEAIKGSGGTVSAKQLVVPSKAVNKLSDAARRLNKHDIAGAQKLLTEAVSIFPAYGAAWNFLGVISCQTDDLVAAEAYFRRALEIDPESYEPTVNLGGVYLSRRRPQEALPFNEKAVVMRPADALSNAQLGKNWFELGRFDTARELLEKAKALDPSHFSLPQLYLSAIYERVGDRSSAKQELEDLLARRPDGPDADVVRKRLLRLGSTPPGN